MRASEGVAFIVLGMMLGAMLWALIALSSLPFYYALRPWIDRLTGAVTWWRGAALAAAGVAPFSVVVLAAGAALLRNEATSPARSTDAWVIVPVLFVAALGPGTCAAAEMWRVVCPPHRDTRGSPLNESLDISPAVRVKEDLEVLRIIIANAAIGLLSVCALFVVPLLVVAIPLLALGFVEFPQGAHWVAFLPVALVAALVLPLIVLASYQIGLWHFVSVRMSGVLLFAGASLAVVAYCVEPLHELYAGTRLGYSGAAWMYTGFLWALTVPALLVTASMLGMSRRLTRLRSEWDPVVRGWRAWPTNLWAHALRALCLPSYLVALPQGRTLPVLFFALAAIGSALQTGLLVGLLTQPPLILTAIVRSALGQNGKPQALPTVGAAITAVSSTELPGATLQNLIVALPAVLVVMLFAVAARVSQKAAAWVIRQGQRRAALGYQTVISQDTRDPVLFLRPFREDRRLFEPSARSVVARVLGLKDRKRTLDEIVLDAASPVGPVIALGGPGEEIAPLGAARLYSDDAEWRTVVRNLADRSRAIIIYIEEGGGILWELGHLLASGHLTKALCILNPRTSVATIERASEQSRRADDAALTGMLEQVRRAIANVPTGKVLVGFRFADGVVAPITAEDASDYTHWCMVNLLLVTIRS